MSFEKLIRIPEDRIGVLIGKSGKIKSKIEETCSVKLDIDSKNGEVQVLSNLIAFSGENPRPIAVIISKALKV